jgi:ribonuclease P protein component
VGERLRGDERLRRRVDFLKCYRAGRRRQGALAILYALPNDFAQPRLGITASRKLGPAVVRNRLKRRVRETYRRWGGRPALPALDLVVHLQPAAASASGTELRAEVERLLRTVVKARAER